MVPLKGKVAKDKLKQKSNGKNKKNKKMKKDKKTKKEKKSKGSKGSKSHGSTSKVEKVHLKTTSLPSGIPKEQPVARNLAGELQSVATPQQSQVLPETQIESEDVRVPLGTVAWNAGNWQRELRQILADTGVDSKDCVVDGTGFLLYFANSNCVLNHNPARNQFPLNVFWSPAEAKAYHDRFATEQQQKAEALEAAAVEANKFEDELAKKLQEEKERLEDLKTKNAEQKLIEDEKKKAEEKARAELKRLEDANASEQKRIQDEKNKAEEKAREDLEVQELKRLQDLKSCCREEAGR